MIDYHIGTVSTRMDMTTVQALDLIGSHDPMIATGLLHEDCRLVAAFARSTDSGEQWTVFMFATRLGTESISMATEFGGYDEAEDCFDDDRIAFIVERSDAFGDCWTKCDTYRLFPIPSETMIFGTSSE